MRTPSDADGKLVRIDAVEIVDAQRGQQPAPGRCDLVIGDFVCRQRRPQVRVVLLSRRLDFLKGWERLGCLQVVDDGEILVEIRKQQHGQIEPGALHGQLRFLQIALLLLRLNPRLDHVGMRDFAAVLQFLADVEESRGFCVGALRGRVLALGHHQSVVRLGHGNDQAASGDLGLGPRLRQRGGGAAIVRNIREGEGLMHVRLADVFVHAVVGDELGRGASRRRRCAVRRKRPVPWV